MPDGMTDVGGKPRTDRRAVAEGTLRLQDATLEAIRRGEVAKGDVVEAARVAALMAAKATPDLLPHCHPIPLTSVDVDLEIQEGLRARVAVEATYRTGVEMEALTATTTALLTAWDMVKPLEKDDDGQYPNARIDDVRVVEKKVSRGKGD